MLDHHFNEDQSEDPLFDDPAMLSGLEKDLQDSARRLGQLPSGLVLTELLAESHRRDRLRWVRQSGMCAAASLAIAVAWFGVASWPKTDPGQPVLTHVNPVLKHVNREGDHPVVQQPLLTKLKLTKLKQPVAISTTTDPKPESPSDLSNPVTESRTADRHKNQDQPLAAADQTGKAVTSSDAVPVFVQVKQDDGQVILAPGFIVPERTVRLDWSRLSPDERRAVWQVLNLDAEHSAAELPTI